MDMELFTRALLADCIAISLPHRTTEVRTRSQSYMNLNNDQTKLAKLSAADQTK
jgi:hypothetical protein